MRQKKYKQVLVDRDIWLLLKQESLNQQKPVKQVLRDICLVWFKLFKPNYKAILDFLKLKKVLENYVRSGGKG